MPKKQHSAFEYWTTWWTLHDQNTALNDTRLDLEVKDLWLTWLETWCLDWLVFILCFSLNTNPDLSRLPDWEPLAYRDITACCCSPWDAVSCTQHPLVVDEGSSTEVRSSILQTDLPGPGSYRGHLTSNNPGVERRLTTHWGDTWHKHRVRPPVCSLDSLCGLWQQPAGL